MERITIEVADDGRVTVMAESPGEDMETMDFESVDEAAGAVQELLMDAGGQDAMSEMAEPEMGDEMVEADMEAMWDEEAAARPKNPNMMM